MTSGGGWEQELRERLHDIFLREAAERLAALDAAVRVVGGGAPPDVAAGQLRDAHRHAHTLKGGARTVGLADVERLAEALEGLLEHLGNCLAAGPGTPEGPDTWVAVSAGVDAIRARLAGRPADVDAVVSGLVARTS